MTFTFQMDAWNAVFAVPVSLVDKHIKLAEKEHLQVILWLLRQAGTPCTTGDVAQALALSESVVEDAIGYWQQAGLLQTEAVPPVRPPVAADAPPPAAPKRAQVRLPKPDAAHLVARIQESETLRYVLQDAETTFGKTLSPAMTTTIVSIFDDYALPAEVFIMLIHYVKSIGKTSTAYLDTVAKDWAASNILTLEAAEEKLRELDEKQLAWKRVERIAGLHHRAPSKREEDAAFRWVQTWQFTDEMLQAAYERCADQTGKFSVPYINKILEKWHRQGVRNLQELQAQQTEQKTQREKSYDIDTLNTIDYFQLPEE